MRAEKTGMNITTVYRIIYQLEEADFVEINQETKKYHIGSNAYHTGSTYIYRNNYLSKIQDILMEISDVTKESIGMAIRDRDKIVSVVEIEVHQPMKMNDAPGRYFQPNKGNYGKCIMAFRNREYIENYLDTHCFEKTFPATLTQKDELLAEYETIRRQGYSESVDELGIDILGTGIPIFDKKGDIWGCVAIAFFREDGWEKKLQELRKVLFSYQKSIEQYVP